MNKSLAKVLTMYLADEGEAILILQCLLKTQLTDSITDGRIAIVLHRIIESLKPLINIILPL